MSFQIDQKVGEFIYVYEATSYWDKKKKQSRQKRIFLGKKDPITGGIIPTKYSLQTGQGMLSIIEIGPKYVFEELFRQIGMKNQLTRFFRRQASAIKSLTQYVLIENESFRNQKRWAIKNNELPMSLPKINALLVELGKNKNQITQFKQNWNPTQPIQISNITATSQEDSDDHSLKIGHQFIKYLSEILSTELSHRIHEAKLSGSITVSELFSRLKEIKRISINTAPPITTEISKSLSIILKKLNIPPPT